MAAEDTAGGEPGTLHDTVTLEGFERVGRTGWIVTATGGEKGRDSPLVTADQADKYRPHSGSLAETIRPPCNRLDVGSELGKCRSVRTGFGSDKKVKLSERRQQLRSRQLTQPSLQSVACDDSLLVFRHDDTNPWIEQQGSGRPSLEMVGVHALPCSSYCLEVGLLRQPVAARKAETVTRRRTWSATGQ